MEDEPVAASPPTPLGDLGPKGHHFVAQGNALVVLHKSKLILLDGDVWGRIATPVDEGD